MQAYRLISFVGVMTAALVLSGCNPETPSQVLTGKIRVKEQILTQTLAAGHMEPTRVRALADNIIRNGKGAVTVTVSYLSGDMTHAGLADKQGAAYKSALEHRGVSNISVVTVPVTDKRYVDQVVVAYPALVALPPKDCGRIPGYEGTDNIEAMDQYKIGCETQTEISKMVADPSDLLGKTDEQDVESRRAGTTVEPYKAGTPNQPLKGFSASTIGQGG